MQSRPYIAVVAVVNLTFIKYPLQCVVSLCVKTADCFVREKFYQVGEYTTYW